MRSLCLELKGDFCLVTKLDKTRIQFSNLLSEDRIIVQTICTIRKDAVSIDDAHTDIWNKEV